jgi:hypothetical protein
MWYDNKWIKNRKECGKKLSCHNLRYYTSTCPEEKTYNINQGSKWNNQDLNLAFGCRYKIPQKWVQCLQPEDMGSTMHWNVCSFQQAITVTTVILSNLTQLESSVLKPTDNLSWSVQAYSFQAKHDGLLEVISVAWQYIKLCRLQWHIKATENTL